MNCLAWNNIPPLSELARAVETHSAPLYLIAVLPERSLPEWTLSAMPSETEQRLYRSIQQKSACIQFNALNALDNVLSDVHLYLVPSESSCRLNTHFGSHSIQWQTEAVPQLDEPLKAWFVPPESVRPSHVLIVGAGIAGAATARLLANQGVRVSVLEADKVAKGGSGNRQGLLYAKISPHPTEQTELLLAGYGYTRRLLETLLPEADCWGGHGVLHLNHDEAERKRNHALGEQTYHAHLYRPVSAQEASQIAGIAIEQDALYWQQGVWLNPPAVVAELLKHELISVHEHSPVLAAEFADSQWTVHTPQGDFVGSHIVYCMGADSPNATERNVSALPFRQIRGQTGVAAASDYSSHLQCAVSGESYISPSWQGQHCYGATFVLNSDDKAWYPHEENQNRAGLADLNTALAESLFSDGINPLEQAHGHSALRCDSLDHLPMVGALGDIAAMQQTYAKLALDKNYRLNTPCPYLPNAYINTAHGTRGLATAPICSAALVAEMLNLPNPLSQRIRTALHPNRAVVRAIVRHSLLVD